jgi:hypothetical protein
MLPIVGVDWVGTEAFAIFGLPFSFDGAGLVGTIVENSH